FAPYTLGGGESHDRHPAVHGEGVADDVARPRAAQPQHGRCDLLGPTRPADGDVLRDLGVGLLVSGYDVAGDLRVDEPRVHRVDPSVTCSSQSTILPSSSSWMAMCVMPVAAVAPCQCFSPGGNQTTSPGRASSTGPPARCTQPQPAVMIRVWPSGCVC